MTMMEGLSSMGTSGSATGVSGSWTGGAAGSVGVVSAGAVGAVGLSGTVVPEAGTWTAGPFTMTLLRTL